MPVPTLDPDDPDGRAQLALREFAHRDRRNRVAAALALFALAGAGPLVSWGVLGDTTATVGTILAAVLCFGCGVALWPWPWSEAEREHHHAVAVWSHVRPATARATPWTRYAAWAIACEDRVELVLISRRGTAEEATSASPFTFTVRRRLDAHSIDDAAVAMEALRAEAAELEANAHDRHLAALAASGRRPDDARHAVQETAEDHQRRLEAQLNHEVAQEDAAERRAQADAVARALRRS